MVHRNDDVPDHARIGALPKHAVVGKVDADVALDQVLAALRRHDIGDDRVHVLEGSGGVAFIEGQGSAVAKAMESEERQRYVDELEGGAVLVGLFGVSDSDQDSTIAAAKEAGLTVLRSFGRWTYS